MFLKTVKQSIAVSVAVMATTTAAFAQSELGDQRSFYEQLGKAYNLVIDGKLEAGEAAYDVILNEPKAAKNLKRAAAEGKGYAMVTQMRAEQAEATTAARKFAFRKSSKDVVEWMEQTVKEHTSQALDFQLIQVMAMVDGKEPDFSGSALSEEYERLSTTPEGFVPTKVATKIVQETKPEPEPVATAKPAPEPAPSVRQSVSVVKLPNTTYVAKTNTNVRSGPGTDNSIVGRVFKGQKIVVDERHKIGLTGGSWLKVRDKNQFVASGNFGFETFPAPKPKTEVVTPKTTAPKTVPAKPEPAPAPKPKVVSNSVCNKRSIGTEFRTTGPTKVYRNTSGSLRFTWGPGVAVRTIVGADSGYWVVRLGAPAPNVNCGYIRQNEATLKRIN